MSPRRLLLLLAAALGAAVAALIARDYLLAGALGDECAYRLAAERILLHAPLYDLSATPGATPCAYFYPPLLAQLLVAVYGLVADPAIAAWTVSALMGAALLYLGGPRRPAERLVVALALIAFLPVAAELKFRNVHLFMAVALVAGLRGHPWALALAACVKFSPAVAIAHLAGRGDWRSARRAVAAGLVLAAFGFALAPGLWADWLGAMSPAAAGSVGTGALPLPYPLRLALAAAVAFAGARRLPPRWSEPLTVACVIAASPLLYPSSLALLAALPRLARTRAG